MDSHTLNYFCFQHKTLAVNAHIKSRRQSFKFYFWNTTTWCRERQPVMTIYTVQYLVWLQHS